MTAPQMNQVLLDLYSCPTMRERWPVVLDEIREALHARSAVVQLLVRDEGQVRSYWTVRDSESEADREIHDRYLGDAVNPRMRARRSPGPGLGPVVIRDRDLFDPDDSAYRELQERLSAARLGTFMSVGSELPGGERLALVLHRDVGCRRDFDADEEGFARRFLPHLRQAVNLSTQLASAGERAGELAGALDSLRAALIVCDADGRICEANRAARELLARRRQVLLHGERLLAASAHDHAALRRLVLETAHDAPDGPARFFVLGGDGAAQLLQVRLQALHSPELAARTAAPTGRPVLLVLSDPSTAPVLPAELLALLFALSPAEAQLAAALCRGLSPGDHAAERRVSVGTVRYQLKQVMAKVGVSRQSQLVQRLYSSVIAQALA